MADYTYWQNALEGKFGPVHEGDPQPGFYRKRLSRAGQFVPTAIWEQDGRIIALVDGKVADAGEIWSYVCQHPIAEEWYLTRTQTGKWPDEDVAVTSSLAPPRHRIGDNNPPQDEAEILKGQIEAATAGVADYAEIKDDETASKAQSLRARLNELSGEADKKREALVRPHLDGQKTVNGIWMPLVKQAKDAADAIRKALNAHETRKERDRQLAEAARLKAEREAREAADAAAAAGKPAPIAPPPPPQAPAPAPQTAIKGAYGRAAAVKMVRVARVVDQDKAYLAMRTHKELVELIAKLAQRAAVAGVAVDGVEVTEEKVVS